MKITSLISASAIALALAAPVYAQTAPTTPAPTTPAPTTPAPTTPAPTAPAPTTPAPTTPAPAGIPAAFANNPVVQQVNAQLTAQGYTITDVVQNANGTISIMSTDANGNPRLIKVNTKTGAVTDTVNAGVPAGTPGVGPNGTLTHEANETGAMEGLENEGGNDNGGNDNGGNDNGGNEGNEGAEGPNDNG